jgi:acetyltransferase
MSVSVVEQMRLFMEPKSVALIGVSRYTGEGSFNVLTNLTNMGFCEGVYPVNPNADEILGIKAYPSIRDVPGNVDLAVILMPRDIVPSLVEECAQRNIRAVVVSGQGFADADDDEGKILQDRIRDAARLGGTRILGPNTLGVANAFARFSSSGIELEMEETPIGLICQSGAFMMGTPTLSFRLVGKAIDLGNACDVGFAEGLEYFENDPDVRLILLHIEGMQDGRRFIQVAHRVAKKKPVLALKTGRSAEGARMAQSHTGSLVGRDEVYDAVFKQCGIIRARDVQELEDLSKAFLNLPLMKGRRVGVATFVGGIGVAIVDSCGEYDLEVAEISPQTRLEIAGSAPSWANVKNPLDVWPVMLAESFSMEHSREILTSFLSDPDIDGAVYIPWVYDEYWDFSRPLLRALDVVTDKPVVCSPYGRCADKVADKLERTGKAIVLPTPERAVRALAGLTRYSQFLQMET